MKELLFKAIRAEAGKDFLKVINMDKLSEQFDLCDEEVYALIRREGYKYGLQIGKITKCGLTVKPY